jgi:hypothetical protein
MAMALVRTTLALTEVEQHLTSTGVVGSSIEAYLTQYLLILLCAEVQEEVSSIVSSAGSRGCDPVLAEFVGQACNRVLRSVGKDEISKLAGMFGAGPKARLNAALDERAVTSYSNAVGARHQVAHKAGASVTLREVGEAVAAAGTILAALEAALA